jgi:uncharacterized protein
MSGTYLLPGLPAPIAARDGLDSPYWQGLADERLLLQRCQACRRWQWGPEWICHRCHSFEMAFEPIPPRGVVYSYERVWHSVHPALERQGPYLVVLVEVDAADGARLIGNLLGDPCQEVAIGTPVIGVFEHHRTTAPAFSLLHWVRSQPAR